MNNVLAIKWFERCIKCRIDSEVLPDVTLSHYHTTCGRYQVVIFFGRYLGELSEIIESRLRDCVNDYSIISTASIVIKKLYYSKSRLSLYITYNIKISNIFVVAEKSDEIKLAFKENNYEKVIELYEKLPKKLQISPRALEYYQHAKSRILDKSHSPSS